MKITKSNIEVYYLRAETGGNWADISLDPSGGGGRISISSDWGNWANYWGACGESFKKFLCNVNMEYFAGKVGEDRAIYFDKTISAWKQEVLEYRRIEELGAIEARQIYDEIKEIERNSTESSIEYDLQKTDYLLEFFNYSPDLSKGVSHRFKRFWELAYVPFVEQLKLEINQR